MRRLARERHPAGPADQEQLGWETVAESGAARRGSGPLHPATPPLQRANTGKLAGRPHQETSVFLISFVFAVSSLIRF